MYCPQCGSKALNPTCTRCLADTDHVAADPNAEFPTFGTIVGRDGRYYAAGFVAKRQKTMMERGAQRRGMPILSVLIGLALTALFFYRAYQLFTGG